MKKLLITTALLATLQLSAAGQKVGIVNFGSCVVESKLGKQEQNAIETMRKQFVSLVEDTDKQMRDINEKLQDQDYVDGLSKEAEDEMKSKMATLQDEMNRYQQQYFQIMQQGQNKIIQAVAMGINQAAEALAAAQGYDLIINKDACFYSASALDITNEVVGEMDKEFDVEEKKQIAAAEAAAAAASEKLDEAKETAALEDNKEEAKG